MRLRLTSLGLVSLLLLVATACINYDEKIELSSSGSGKIVMHYSVSQQLYSLISMGSEGGDEKNEIPFKFKEDEIRADLNVPGVKVEKVENKAEGDNQHFYVHATFDKITDLNQVKTFKGMQFEWKEEGDTVTFQRVLTGSGGDDSRSNQAGDDMAAAMLGNAKFIFQVTLPANALPSPETNGTIQSDGQTVSWEFPLTQLDETRTMTARFKRGGLFSGKIILLAAGAGISLITLVLVVFMARKM